MTPPAGEFEVLARIQERLGPLAGAGCRRPHPGEVYSGDDAAVLVLEGGSQLLLAIDLVVEGVHVDLRFGSLADAGWKAVAVNASDIAAMGGRPLHVVAGVSAPPATDLEAVAAGMTEACASYGIALVGGDLTQGAHLVLSVAITGTCDGRTPVLRSGARPGDAIWVTGPLGASAAGLELLRSGLPGGGEPRPDAASAGLVSAYLRPRPRLGEGVAAAAAGATAMIDVSDGLSRDLDHIASQSGVGVRLTAVPVAEGASLEQALGGGEDYELVFTAPAGAAVVEGFAARSLTPPLRIGTCSDVAGERLLEGEPFPISGWEHSFGE